MTSLMSTPSYEIVNAYTGTVLPQFFGADAVTRFLMRSDHNAGDYDVHPRTGGKAMRGDLWLAEHAEPAATGDEGSDGPDGDDTPASASSVPETRRLIGEILATGKADELTNELKDVTTPASDDEFRALLTKLIAAERDYAICDNRLMGPQANTAAFRASVLRNEVELHYATLKDENERLQRKVRELKRDFGVGTTFVDPDEATGKQSVADNPPPIQIDIDRW